MQHATAALSTWSPTQPRDGWRSRDCESRSFIDVRSAQPVTSLASSSPPATPRVHSGHAPRVSMGGEALSQREGEALGWLARGLTQKEAAYEMGIAASTLRVLLYRAAKKRGGRASFCEAPDSSVTA